MTHAHRTLLRIDALAWGVEHRVLGGPWTATLESGAVLAVLGPNGAGKTTLFRTLIGALPATAGSVSWAGVSRSRARSPSGLATRVAFVPQQGEAVPDMTVEDYALLGRIAHRGWFARPTAPDRDLVGAALDRLGLARLARRPLAEISGGERQLAGLARALAQQAAVLILDEPVASLDPANQQQVLGQMAALAAEGLALIFSTHQPEHAHRLASRVLAVDGRGPGTFGPPETVLTGPVLSRLYGFPMQRIQAGGRTFFAPADA